MKKWIIGLGLLVALFATLLWLGMPVLRALPPLTGNYAVGTRDLYLNDTSNDEPRSLVAHCWYPLESHANLKKKPYLGSKMAHFTKLFAQMYHVPEWLSGIAWNSAKTRSYEGGELSSTMSSYPLVIFSHGLLGLPSDMYTGMLEELASHGFIVIGIDHPSFNLLTQFPDDTMKSSAELSVAFATMSPAEQKEFQSNALEIYKADMRLVLDQLQQYNKKPDHFLYKRLDMQKIGIMGHSAGGTAAIEFCRADDRCKACADLDGWYDHIIMPQPLKIPLLLLFGQKSLEVTEPSPEYLQRKRLTHEQYYKRERTIAEHRQVLCSSSTCSMVIVPDGTHDDFDDHNFLKWPLRSLKERDAYSFMAFINNAVVSFFKQSL